MKRPTLHAPHMAGLYELDRIADDAVDLAEQIKEQVRRLRQEDTERGGTDRDTTA